MLTNNSYEATIATDLSVTTQRKCSRPTALVASYNIQDFHYDRRALNKLVIANKASLSFSRFVNLLSPLCTLTYDKAKKMKEPINHESLSSLTLTDKLFLDFNYLPHYHRLSDKGLNALTKCVTTTINGILNKFSFVYGRSATNKHLQISCTCSFCQAFKLLPPLLSQLLNGATK